MKKLTLIIFMTVFCLLNALENHSLINFTFETSTKEAISIKFHHQNYEKKQIKINGKTYLQFESKNSTPILSEGKPALPFFSTFIQLPNKGIVSVDYTINSKKIIHPKNSLYPSQGTTFEDLKTNFLYNENYYSNGEEFPKKIVTIGKPKIIRGIRVAALHVYPLHYNPQKNQIISYEDISISLSFDENQKGGNEIISKRNQSSSKKFEHFFKSTIANYHRERTELQKTSAVIIYNSNLNIENLINKLALLKRREGFEVHIANQNICGTSTSSIKNYLQDAYDNWDNPPEYIILVGDVDGDISVPTWRENLSNYHGSGDVPYIYLDGDDYLPDAFIGRISVSSITELQTYINKEIRYSTSPTIAGSDWMNHTLLVGGTIESGISTVFTCLNTKEMMLDVDPTATFTELYSQIPSPDSMQTSLNDGSLFFFYRGIYGMSGWDESYIHNLSNTNKLFNAVIITCDTGNYSDATCRTESIIRAGTPGNLKGGIEAIGMSTSHTHTTFNNILLGGISYGIFIDGMRTMGEAINMGRYSLCMAYGDSNPTEAKIFSYWINLMGDPSVNIYVTKPKTMNLTYDDTLSVGSNSTLINVKDDNGVGISGAKVTLYQSESNLSVSGETDINGNVRLFFDQNTVGKVLLTATKDDYTQNNGSIFLNGQPTVSIENVNVDDSENGNNNQQLNPGESANLIISVKNFTDETVNDLAGRLSSEDEFVTISNSIQNFGNINPNLSIAQSGFTVIVAPNCPNNHQIKFLLTLTDGNSNIYQSYFVLKSLTGDAEIISYLIDDGNNNILDLNETGHIIFALKNIGTEAIPNVYGKLISENSDFIVEDSVAYFGDISPNEIVDCSFNKFSYKTSIQLTPGQKIHVKLVLFNEFGYQEIEDYFLPVGIITVTDPLGPDDYGYICYDEGDINYAEVPKYDWIEIDPNLSDYQGEPVNLTDHGENEDDIKQVNLPFTFRFYGKEYNTVSICSNGWISFLPTEQAQFRNWRIPGPLGPGAMIAAFWDDLLNGQVYTYYLKSSNKFIIEWSNVQNYAGRTETFEIILADPKYNPTSTLDGKIKIQYKHFENIDSGSEFTHGNYCTVGIEDETQTRGLEYTFNNEYPTAAKPLGDETAILFSGSPKAIDGIFLTLGNLCIYDENGSGLVEAGENVNLGVMIRNLGLQKITDIGASLKTDDPYVTINKSNSNYSEILPESSNSNDTYFNFTVSKECPDEHKILFNLNLTSEIYSKKLSFEIINHKAKIQFGKLKVWDGKENDDGVADPGETVNLMIPIKNTTLGNTGEINLEITTSNSNIEIKDTQLKINNIVHQSSIQKSVEIKIHPECPAYQSVKIHISASGNNIEPIEMDYYLGIKYLNYSNSFDDDSGDFTSDTGWEWGMSSIVEAHSGDKLWGTALNGNYDINSDYYLQTPPIFVSPDFQLQFYQNYYFGWGDGGNVQISTDRGKTFTPIIPENGYPSEETSAMDEPCYTNSSFGWKLATFNVHVDNLNGIIIRWHLASNSVFVKKGWYIDDITLNNLHVPLSFISGQINLQNKNNDVQKILICNGNDLTFPDESGIYKLVVEPKTYNLSASCSGYETKIINNIFCQDGIENNNINFTIKFLPPPTELNYSMNPDEKDLGILLNWNDENAQLEDFKYYNIFRQTNSGAYKFLKSQTANTYFDKNVEEANYHYYVESIYSEGKSDSSNVISLHYDKDYHPPVYTDNLKQNYPNPFYFSGKGQKNFGTTINFTLHKDSSVNLSIYNIRGQRVRTLINTEMKKGKHNVIWNGENDDNKIVSSGVYLYRLKTKNYSFVRKLIFIK